MFPFGWDDFWGFGLITRANQGLCFSAQPCFSSTLAAGFRWMVRSWSLFVSLWLNHPSPHILCLLMRAGSSHGCEIEFSATSISRCSASTSSDKQKVLMMLTLGSVPNGTHLIEGNGNGWRCALKQRTEKHDSSTSSSSSHFLPLFPSATCSAGSVGEFH